MAAECQCLLLILQVMDKEVENFFNVSVFEFISLKCD